MNLIIDIGNTTTKVEVFENNKTIISEIYKIFSLDLLLNFLSIHKLNNKIKAAIISSVAYYPEDIVDFLKDNCFFIFFDDSTPIPIKNLYQTPQTLGKDRLASAIAANHLFPGQNVLCVDIGTCIKYDFVNNNNEYCGGAISPGYEMRFKALNTFTEKLPLIEIKPIDFFIGKNTEESILSGVINGTSLEIANMISKYQNKYSQLKIIFSGGAMKNFDKELKISIFAVTNIVNLGLNIVLEFNKLVKN